MERQNAAQSRFIALTAEIGSQLAKLQEMQTNHFDTMPDSVTWADVGSLTYLRDSLAATLEFLTPQKP